MKRSSFSREPGGGGGHLFLKGHLEQPPREAGGFPGGQFDPCEASPKRFLCSLSGKCVKLPYGLGAIRGVVVRRRPGAQHPAWSSAGALVAVGGPASLPACIQPAPPHQSSPTSCLPLTSAWLLAGRATSPRGPRLFKSSAAAHPISAQTACLIWMSSCLSPLGGQHCYRTLSAQNSRRLVSQSLGGRGLRLGVGPHPGLRGWAPCLRTQPPAASALSHAVPSLRTRHAWG